MGVLQNLVVTFDNGEVTRLYLLEKCGKQRIGAKQPNQNEVTTGSPMKINVPNAKEQSCSAQ